MIGYKMVRCERVNSGLCGRRSVATMSLQANQQDMNADGI